MDPAQNSGVQGIHPTRPYIYFSSGQSLTVTAFFRLDVLLWVVFKVLPTDHKKFQVTWLSMPVSFIQAKRRRAVGGVCMLIANQGNGGVPLGCGLNRPKSHPAIGSHSLQRSNFPTYVLNVFQIQTCRFLSCIKTWDQFALFLPSFIHVGLKEWDMSLIRKDFRRNVTQ